MKVDMIMFEKMGAVFLFPCLKWRAKHSLKNKYKKQSYMYSIFYKLDGLFVCSVDKFCKRFGYLKRRETQLYLPSL